MSLSTRLHTKTHLSSRTPALELRVSKKLSLLSISTRVATQLSMAQQPPLSSNPPTYPIRTLLLNHTDKIQDERTSARHLVVPVRSNRLSHSRLSLLSMPLSASDSLRALSVSRLSSAQRSAIRITTHQSLRSSSRNLVSTLDTQKENVSVRLEWLGLLSVSVNRRKWFLRIRIHAVLYE